MPNVFDYLDWRGDLSIKNDAFNDVDALILSRLSYFPFDDIVSADINDKITIKNASDKFFATDLNNDKILWEGDAELLKACAESERFKNMKRSGYVHSVAREKQMQVSAVVIEITEN